MEMLKMLKARVGGVVSCSCLKATTWNENVGTSQQQVLVREIYLKYCNYQLAHSPTLPS